jgi:ferritin-like metal-binding protein YciE
MPLTDNKSKETLLDWLRDAHAMEDSIVEVLEKQVKMLDHKPQIQGKVREHLEITKQQRDRLAELVEKLGGKTSAVKSITGNFLANVQALSMSSAPDAIVKNALSDFAVEHYEIACYTALMAAAEQQGQQEVVRVCREFIDQEREMANFLEHHLPRITTEYLGQQQTAKR